MEDRLYADRTLPATRAAEWACQFVECVHVSCTEQFVLSEFARLAARAAVGAGPDLEIIATVAERAHHQPLGIPAIRMAAGSLGTSKITGTFRDPHIGHFNRASKLVIGNAPPLV
jgi:hypothetical protein